MYIYSIIYIQLDDILLYLFQSNTIRLYLRYGVQELLTLYHSCLLIMCCTSLKDFTINFIRNNLNYQNQICKRNSLIIPFEVGQEIFDKAIEDKEPFEENELEFFTHDILNLTDISLRQSKFIYIKNYEFLRNQPIRNIFLIDFQSVFKIPIIKTVVNLELINCHLTREDCIHLEEFLRNCECLKSIKINEQKNLGDSFNNLINGLESSCMSLVKIDLSFCSLTENQSIIFGCLLEKCYCLEEVFLNVNPYFGKGFKKICQGLNSSSKSLRILQLIDCCLTEEQSFCLGGLLENCISLEEINLSHNQNFRNGFIKICSGLRSSSQCLKKITLHDCYLTDIQNLWLIRLLKQCTLLQDVTLSWQEHGERVIKIWVGLKSSSSTLRRINLDYSSFVKEQIYDFSDLLKCCTRLQEITLGWINFTEKQFEMICNALKSAMYSLLKLDMPQCSLSAKQSVCLGRLLKNCRSLQSINLSVNPEMGDGFMDICNGLKSSCRSLNNIFFHNCQLENYQIPWLVSLLNDCQLLKEIDLSLNPLIYGSFQEICNSLLNSSNSLTNFDVHDCSFTSQQGLIYSLFLEHCHYLQKIHLQWNTNFNQSFQNICYSLKYSGNSITSVDVSNCSLNKEKSVWLGDFFKSCKSLQSVILNWNQNFGDGFKSICEGLLSSAHCLLKIDLSYTSLTEKQASWLKSLLENCHILREIIFIFNQNLGAGFKDICTGLNTCHKSLSKIDFCDCGITEEQSIYLSELLMNCCSLQEVNLSGNHIMGNGFGRICSSLKSSRLSLTELGFKHCFLTDKQESCLKKLMDDCILLHNNDIFSLSIL